MIAEWKFPAEGVVDAKIPVTCSDHGKHTLTVRASNVRRTGGELLAQLTVGLDTTTIYKDATTKIERDDDRHKLANKIYGTRQTPGKITCGLMREYPVTYFEADLLVYSEQFFSKLMSSMDDGPTNGDAEPSIIPCHIGGMLLEEGGTIMYAPPKSGKSYTGLLVAVSLDAGVSHLWEVKRPVRTGYVNLERGKRSLTRRLGLVNRVLGLPADRPLVMLNRRGRTFADVYDRVLHLMEEHRLEVLVLDSLTRGGFGNLNGNEEANRAMDMLNAASPSWLAIAHTPRSDQSHVFGSQMFDAAMDVGIQIRRQRKDDGTLGVLFNVQETNDIPAPPPRILAYEFNQYGLWNVREAEPGEFPDLEEGPRTPAMTIRDAIICALQDEDGDEDELVDLVRQMVPGAKRDSIRRKLEQYDGRFWASGRDGRYVLLAVPTEGFRE